MRALLLTLSFLCTPLLAAQQATFADRLQAARKELAELPKDDNDETKAKRAALEQKVKWLDRGVELTKLRQRLASATLDGRAEAVKSAKTLPDLAPLAAGWDAIDLSERSLQLDARRKELQRVRNKLDERRSAFVAAESEANAMLQNIAKETTQAESRTAKSLSEDQAKMSKELAEVRTRLAAKGESAPKPEQLAALKLREEVLALELEAINSQETQKARWREVLAAEKTHWETFRNQLVKERLDVVRTNLARADTAIAQLTAELLPEISLSQSTAPEIVEVFQRARERVRSLIQAVAERNTTNAKLLSDERQVKTWRDEAKSRLEKALEETAADKQTSQAVLYFKLRIARNDLERYLRSSLKDPLWEKLPTQVSQLESALDAAAANLAAIEPRFESELRSALKIKRDEIPKELRQPMREWIRRERTEAQELVERIERATLSTLTALGALQEQRRLLEHGIAELDLRGLFLRDPSRLSQQNLSWLGRLWLTESPRLLGNLASLPGEVWSKAMRGSGSRGTGRLRLVLGILLVLFGAALAIVLRRRTARLFAAFERENRPGKRQEHQLAYHGFLWRAALPAGIGGMFLVVAGVKALAPEDKRLAAALGELFLVAGAWWALTKICVRAMRADLRLLPLDDQKAARVQFLSITALVFWLIGQLGHVTYGLSPDPRGFGVMQLLETLRNAGLLVVLLAFWWMGGLLRQLFPPADKGGVPVLRSFVMLMKWPARITLVVALVLWLLSYHGLSIALGLGVVGVLAGVVVGVVCHQTLREEIRHRFLPREDGSINWFAGYVEIFEVVVTLGAVLLTFSLIQRLDISDWQAVGAIKLWGEQVTDASGQVTADERVYVYSVVGFVVAVLLTLALTRRTRTAISQLLENRFDRGLRFTLATLTSYAIAVVGTLVAFDFLHLGFQRLQWLLAALTVGLGFGLQEIVSNFFSGIILLFERPLRVGDIVQVGDTLGEVRKITIRSTTVTSYDNVDVIVPNKDFITQSITNWTGTDRDMRSKIEIGVAYGSDLKKVRELLLETVQKHGRVYKKPPPAVYLMAFADSSINFSVRYYTSVDYKLGTFSDLHFAIEAAFDREGIEIPFPQSDIRLKEAVPISTTRENGEAVADDSEASGPRRQGTG